VYCSSYIQEFDYYILACEHARLKLLERLRRDRLGWLARWRRWGPRVALMPAAHPPSATSSEHLEEHLGLLRSPAAPHRAAATHRTCGGGPLSQRVRVGLCLLSFVLLALQALQPASPAAANLLLPTALPTDNAHTYTPYTYTPTHTRRHTHADTYTRTRTRRLLLPACAYLCTPLAPACCALAAGARLTRRHTRLKRHHARLTRHHTCHPSDRWPSSSRHVATHATSLLLSTLGVVPPWANSGITMTGILMTP
jgi:hypothetical protein